MLVGQTKRLDQIPGKPRLRIKITEHLEGLIGIVDNFVQSRLVHPRCFVVLTTSRLNLAVSSNKLFRTRTVVPNAGGLTDLIAGSSIQTRIVPAAAISAREVTNTGRDTTVLLVEKRDHQNFLSYKYIKQLPRQNIFRCLIARNPEPLPPAKRDETLPYALFLFIGKYMEMIV